MSDMVKIGKKKKTKPVETKVVERADVSNNLNLRVVVETVQVNFRMPKALQEFALELSAKESIKRKRTVTVTNIYVTAMMEYAEKRGFKDD